MSHARLFGIDVKHTYYRSGLCGDFALAPTGDTERLLRNHRCVVKPKAHGADIYVETGGDGKPKIAFWQDATLSFELRLKNPDFPLFTDPASPSGSAGFQITYPRQTLDKYFAKVDIRRDFNQPGGDVEIVFSAKPVIWFYYLITDQGGSGTDFSVAGQDSQAITWKQMEGADRISLKLAEQYPGMRRLRFASEQLIPCRESGLRHIQLLFGGNTIIESLPNPSWRNYFQTEREANGVGGDAIFQVVKFLTNTTLTKV
ncbi:hypothetical protein ANRL3_01295 [Anaerolineae bacterium]|nr:hypothetical protein ANRL3_01295 [Anaerolineae bacterium]